MFSKRVQSLRTQSLSRQINRRVLLLSLIALIGLGGTLIESLKRRLDNVHHELVQVNREAAETFDLFILDLKSSLISTGATLHASKDNTTNLRYFISRYPSILELVYLDEQGKPINQIQTFGRVPQRRVSLTWRENTLEPRQINISNLQYEAGNPYVDIAVAALNDIGLPTGTLIARLDLTELWDTTLDVDVGRTGYSYLTTQVGHIITYHNLRVFNEQEKNLEQRIGKTPQAITQANLPIYRGLSGQWVLASARPLRDVSWYAIVEQPLQEALGPLLLPLILLVAVTLLMMAILWNTVRFTQRRLVNPLQQLDNILKDTRQGQAIPSIELNYTDELSQLADSLNQISQENSELYNSLEEQVQQRTIELQRSQEKFSKAFYSNTDPMGIVTFPEGHFIELNDALIAIYASSREELIDQAFEVFELSSLDQQQPFSQVLHEQGDIHNWEVKIPLARLSDRVYLFSAELMTLNNQQYSLLSLKDITARKQAEALLARRNRDLRSRIRLANLLTQIARNFLDQDLDSSTEDALKAIATFTNADRACLSQYSNDNKALQVTYEWCGSNIKPSSDRLQPISLREITWLHNQLLTKGVVNIASIDTLPANASKEKDLLKQRFFQSLLMIPLLQNHDAIGFIGIETLQRPRQWSLEDIDILKLFGEFIALGRARHQAENRLAQAKEDAELANRAKSEFLANMSHELRTPLNAILGFSQLMARDKELSADQKNTLSIINRSGEHLLTLINDILEMSKIESGKVTLNSTDFDLRQMLDSLQDMLGTKAQRKGLQFQIEYATTLPRYIHTDENKLRQVLINLLGNAIKFTNQGRILLRTQSTKIPNQLSFSVIDTGVGIAPDDIDILFEPFSQSQSGKQSNQGTGLGLPISKTFVDLMGGHLTVKSQLGKGSTFTFTILTLPFQGHLSAPDIDTHSRRIVGLAPHQNVPKILVAEDHLESRELIIKLLSDIGFTVMAASNGKEAVNICSTWHPDLVWMDMRMPGMDGIEATQHIKRQSNPPIVIALTAHAFNEDRSQALAIGCDDFIRKPFMAQDIWEKVAIHLGVTYLYEDTSAEPSTALKQQDIAQRPAEIYQQLKTMPRTWQQSLESAATRLSTSSVLQVLEQLPPDKSLLKTELERLIEDFRYDVILAMLKE